MPAEPLLACCVCTWAAVAAAVCRCDAIAEAVVPMVYGGRSTRGINSTNTAPQVAAVRAVYCAGPKTRASAQAPPTRRHDPLDQRAAAAAAAAASPLQATTDAGAIAAEAADRCGPVEDGGGGGGVTSLSSAGPCLLPTDRAGLELSEAGLAALAELARGGSRGGESFLRVHWVGVPKGLRARRVNRRRRRVGAAAAAARGCRAARLPGAESQRRALPAMVPQPQPRHGRRRRRRCPPPWAQWGAGGGSCWADAALPGGH
jgi:hypothetical protein